MIIAYGSHVFSTGTALVAKGRFWPSYRVVFCLREVVPGVTRDGQCLLMTLAQQVVSSHLLPAAPAQPQ